MSGPTEVSPEPSSRKSRQYRITYVDSRATKAVNSPNKGSDKGSEGSPLKTRRRRVKPTMAEENSNNRAISRRKPNLSVNTSGAEGSNEGSLTPCALNATPSESSTPFGVRGSSDLRSPGGAKSPTHASDGAAVPDFITQTDRYGNASTPRSARAVAEANKQDPSGGADGNSEKDHLDVDPCETLLDSIRLMCCCLLADENPGIAGKDAKAQASKHVDAPAPTFTVTEDKEEVPVKLLPPHHPDDVGKKCLVLDLDETLVHSSFRAVPGADFVIPVQIEDVVHFVYVAKRPGVDEFLIEMAKHYELVIYTASLNKYADPLLDLLDPKRVIRARLFRESCVYYEGNYVKDMSLIDRDLSQAIIVDNSPSSYIFHPENAIDCSSFIDDPADRELNQIASFLIGIKDAKDVRHLAPQWRDWPKVRGFENKSPVPEDESPAPED